FLRQSLDLFYLKYGDFTGQLTDVNFGVEYKAWQHWGFGLALNRFIINLRADSSNYPNLDLTGEVEHGQNGVFAYLRYPWLSARGLGPRTISAEPGGEPCENRGSSSERVLGIRSQVMTTQAERAAAFNALHAAPGAFVAPNPWDAGSARILAALGFQA